MGYAILIAVCRCGRTFGCNPMSVPSINNEPFCKECVDAANPIRVQNGLEPIRYADDAYMPVDEREMP